MAMVPSLSIRSVGALIQASDSMTRAVRYRSPATNAHPTPPGTPTKSLTAVVIQCCQYCYIPSITVIMSMMMMMMIIISIIFIFIMIDDRGKYPMHMKAL